MSRVKTFDNTGLATAGRIYAGDLNLIQDQFADLTNLSQTVSVGTLKVGETGLQLVRYGAGEARISGLLRVDGILRGLGGLYAGAFTNAQRNSIGSGFRPYGLIILNTDANEIQWNKGTDATPNWSSISPVLGNDSISTSMLQNLSVTLAKLAASSVDASKIDGSLKPSVAAAAGTEALRAIGATGSTVVAGNDSRLTDQRVPTDASVTVAKLAAGLLVPYSKLMLANSILNADVATGAAIVYSKLNLANSILNSDVAPGAAIAKSKLNLAGQIGLADLNFTPALQSALDSEVSSRTNADSTLSTGISSEAATRSSQITGVYSYLASNYYFSRADTVAVTLDGGSDASIPFLSPFPNGVVSLVLTNGDAGVGDLVISSYPNNLDRFGFKIHVYSIGPGAIPGVTIRVNYLAVGF